MPTVPQYGGPQVQARALQTPMQGTPDVSSGLMQAGRALDQIGELADREVKRQATDEAFQLETGIKSDWLTTDAELRKRYRGSNTQGYREEVDKWWAEAPSKYGQDASPLAKTLATKSIAQYQLQAKASSAGYLNSEQEKALTENYVSGQAVAIQSGLRDINPANAQAVATASLQAMNEATSRMAAVRGWSAEQVQAERLKNSSLFHRAAIGALVDADATAAKAYYDANRSQIDGAHYGQLDGAIKSAADTQEAKRMADSMATLPYDQQLSKVADIKDPALRDKARTAVKQNQGDMLAAQQAKEKQASDAAWQMVGQGRRVPEALLQTMDGRERVQLQDHLRQRAEHAALMGAKPVKTDPETLAKVYDLMRENPDEFKALRMQTLAYKLAGSDIEQVARIQRDMLDPAKEKDAVSLSMQIGAYSRGMKPEDRALFESAAQDEVIKFQQTNKRPPTSKERQEMLDKLKLEGITDDGWFWDTKKKRYKMTPEELAGAKFPDAPASKPTAVKTADDYNKLPKGARYLAPDGTTRTKQ